MRKNLTDVTKAIANDLKIPKVTVETVLRCYFNVLTESILAGEDINIPNIMSVKLKQQADGGVSLRGRVSAVLRAKLCERVTDVI